MATPVYIENLRALFEKIMHQNNLKPEDIKGEKSRINFSSKGRFDCDCDHSWHSNFSWVTFDLTKCEIIKRWTMKCRECLEKEDVESLLYPTFSVQQLEEMFRKVVSIYKGENTNPEIDIGYRARRNFKYPHLPLLCEKCQWGMVQCWNRRHLY